MILKSWKSQLELKRIKMVIGGSDGDVEKSEGPKGSVCVCESIHQ